MPTISLSVNDQTIFCFILKISLMNFLPILLMKIKSLSLQICIFLPSSLIVLIIEEIGDIVHYHLSLPVSMCVFTCFHAFMELIPLTLIVLKTGI